jgi:Na+/citrate or Na+/malate symporter
MFANFIIVIPAFTASLIILGIGLTVAFYLRQSIEDSEVTGWKFISLSFFYFILFVVGIYSLRTALVILKETSLQYILVGYSIIFFVSVAFFHLKNFKA